MTTFLQLTPHDPLIARDGRPFGAGQGNRMRGLPWPLPSVVAGSFRTALVKAGTGDFSGETPKKLLEQVSVAGVFPVHKDELYLPAPNDCAWDDKPDLVHRVQPIKLEAGEGVDFPKNGADLWPVRLSAEQATEEFKAKSTPAWWPVTRFEQWLTSNEIEYRPDWFTDKFLSAPMQSMRDHVVIASNSGTAKEGEIFASSNLNVTHLPRFGVKLDDEKIPFKDRFAEVTLSARVTIDDPSLKHTHLNIWHPLGGERRMVHWQQADSTLWECPSTVREALKNTTRIRMVLATPAVFKDGWKPGWLSNGLEGELSGVKLKLVGVSNGRWKAVSGWSLAATKDQPRGPKAIRRMVPAGSVYFFNVLEGDASQLADKMWLQSVSDSLQEQRDGFGLAIWGTW